MKTRKITTLILALCSLSLASFAQDDDGEKAPRQPVQGNKGISLNLVGIANWALNTGTDPFNNTRVLDFRYFLSDRLALRVGLGANTTSTKTEAVNDSTGGIPLTETETINKSSAFTFGVGAEYHIANKSKTIDPYVGGGIYLSTIGKNTAENFSRTTIANGDYNEMRSVTTTPGGLGFAVGVNAGFFWFFAENIAVGGEYGFGFGTGSTGGDTEIVNTTESSTGGVVTSTEASTTSTNRTNNATFRTGNTGAINLLVIF